MKKYLFMKTLISGITGVLSYFWLQMIGVEFAGIWAFIVFITSYIPTIGAIVACALPILYSLITAPSLHQPILTAIGLKEKQANSSIRTTFGEENTKEDVDFLINNLERIVNEIRTNKEKTI